MSTERAPYAGSTLDPGSLRYALDPSTGVSIPLGPREEGEHFIPAEGWRHDTMIRANGDILLIPSGQHPRQQASRARLLALYPDLVPFKYSGERWEWKTEHGHCFAPVEDWKLVAHLTTLFGEPTRRIAAPKFETRPRVKKHAA